MKSMIYGFMVVLMIVMKFLVIQNAFLHSRHVYQQALKGASFEETHEKSLDRFSDIVDQLQGTLLVKQLEYRNRPRFLGVEAQINGFMFRRAVLEDYDS